MELPIYWQNTYKGPRSEKFHQQYYVQARTVNALHQLATSSGLPKGLRVLQVRRIEHSELWTRYIDAKASLQNKLMELGIERFLGAHDLDGRPTAGHVLTTTRIADLGLENTVSLDHLDELLNEHLLWHGTSKETAETIVVDDFRIDHAKVAHGKRFGVGAYFAEDLDKSLQYAPEDVDAKRWVLLCRVLCGNMYYTESNIKTDAIQIASCTRNNSVLANPSGEGPREFIVPNADQIYPEYILELGKCNEDLAEVIGAAFPAAWEKPDEPL